MTNPIPGTTAVAASAGNALTGMFMLAAQKLSEPYRSLFDRLYLKGDSADAIKSSLNITDAEYRERESTMLRTLAAATQPLAH